jgi:nucleoside-diphosphate-sugar epimerase
MARRPVVLVTGASGEMGHGLITRLAELGTFDILALDIRPLDPELSRHCAAIQVGDILDRHLLDRLRSEFEISVVFHLAALLSTRAEFVPETAHEVNVEGTLGLFRLAVEEGRSHGRPVRFLFPSSIAVYGLPDLDTKRKAGRVVEHEWLLPVTMYGCNKLYCEHLGRYFARHYRQLAAQSEGSGVDFRAIRFPGLILDDTRARRDWGFRPAYDLARTINEYLLPNVTRRYARGSERSAGATPGETSHVR